MKLNTKNSIRPYMWRGLDNHLIITSYGGNSHNFLLVSLVIKILKLWYYVLFTTSLVFEIPPPPPFMNICKTIWWKHVHIKYNNLFKHHFDHECTTHPPLFLAINKVQQSEGQCSKLRIKFSKVYIIIIFLTTLWSTYIMAT